MSDSVQSKPSTAAGQEAAAPAPGPGQRFVFLDGLRGVAAMWVVLYHAAEGHQIEKLQ